MSIFFSIKSSEDLLAPLVFAAFGILNSIISFELITSLLSFLAFVGFIYSKIVYYSINWGRGLCTPRFAFSRVLIQHLLSHLFYKYAKQFCYCMIFVMIGCLDEMNNWTIESLNLSLCIRRILEDFNVWNFLINLWCSNTFTYVSFLKLILLGKLTLASIF